MRAFVFRCATHAESTRFGVPFPLTGQAGKEAAARLVARAEETRTRDATIFERATPVALRAMRTNRGGNSTRRENGKERKGIA